MSVNRRDHRAWRGVFEDLTIEVFGRAKTLRGRYVVFIVQMHSRPPKTYGAFIEGSAQRKFWLGGDPSSCALKVRLDFARVVDDFKLGHFSGDDWQPGAPPSVFSGVQ